MRKTHSSCVLRLASCVLVSLAAAKSFAEPIREWDWHMPGEVYKELEFTDRAQVDRAVKLFEQAVDAERRGVKVTDLVPRYRNAAGEWRKVQVQGETAGTGNEPLLAYAVFMQGYAKQQARDRNEAIKLYNEVLDIYPEQKFIAVPARYMLSRVKRELGDIKQANAELEEIVEDKGADGHKIFYNVIRSLASVRWGEGKAEEAAELWEKIVFTQKKIDWSLWKWSRDDLVLARIVTQDFANLEAALFAGLGPEKKKERVGAICENAKWVSEIDRYGQHGVTAYLDRKFPPEKKKAERKREVEKIRKGYIAWLGGESGVFEGHDDGWAYAIAQLRALYGYAKTEEIMNRVKALEPMVKGAKPDQIDGRARTLAFELATIGQKDAARSAAAMAKNTLYRLHLQYELESQFGEWKAAMMYLTEYIGTQPPPDPGALKGAKYDLAGFYRHRLGEPEKAIKIYLELDDPPRTLWALAETYRECGKKKESYMTLTELTSVFPDEAANAVLRYAQWKEADGEKEKAIMLYRQLLKNPKWKQSGASSQAHQALERFGIATGGAMTNEVR